MKILIADDEELVRVGLKDLITRINPGAEIFEAANGRKMIEAVEKYHPSLCFADIRMPGISGLEAIELVSGEHQDISWVILSGYSDFQYARKALTLGALDYLLKPVTEDEVAAVLLKATSVQLEAKRLKREKFEYRVGGVINNSSAAEFDDYLLEIGSYAALVFIPDVKLPASSVEFQKELFISLRTWIDSHPLAEYAGLFNIKDGFPAVISGGLKPEKLLYEIKLGMPEFTEDRYKTVLSPVQNRLQDLLSYFDNATDILEADLDTAIEAGTDNTSRIVRQAKLFVQEKYTEQIGVAQIAEELNVTPNYLSSLFKKHMNISFTRYITDIRLNEAPGILETPGISVKEAATRLGYMSSRHFTRLFRERYGKTPSEYRK